MAKKDIIEQINALGIPGVVASEDLTVEQLNNLQALIESSQKLAAIEDQQSDKDAEIAELKATNEKLEQDVVALNAELQKATDINAATGTKAVVTVEGKSYIINFPVSVGEEKYTVEQIAANTEIELDGEKIGIATHLVSINSFALKQVGN